jgi:exodeoxyribonuclease VII large subunit
MSTIDPVFTVGGIAANRERALRALAADGLLDANARFPLPLVPLRVGLVTSRGSAAYHDFVHELAASGYAWELSVFDVRVQGAAASRRIAYVLRELARSSIDVVVLARGGGARADLVPFDSELVARAIAAMPVPVLVGVGHETDRSVADAVAHSSCKTPTACAQLLVQRVRAFASHLDTVGIRIVGRARARGALAVRELDDVARRVRAVPAALSRERARLEQGRVRAIAVGRRRAADASRALGSHERTVTTLARHQLARAGLRLDAVEGRVHALDPARVLERGYTITRTADGRVVRRAGDAPVGAELVTELASGALVSRVESSRDREPPA